MSAVVAERDPAVRAPWRSVAIPSEHGGWGLTLEPVLLGLLVAPSGAGMALGVAAFTAFLLRTPAKLIAVDVRRGRWLDRTRRARRVAIAETVLLVSSLAVAVALSGWSWLVPVLIAGPLIAIEFAFDIRSRGRRLIPELCGAIGISAAAASIVIAAGQGGGLAAGVWLVLAARAVGAIPFVRVQIVRLRRGRGPVWQSDIAQAVSLAVAAGAVLAEQRMLAGALGVAGLAGAQCVWVRRPPMPAKQIGLRQMGMGLALVVVTAAGVLW
jgi:hypothetical protein